MVRAKRHFQVVDAKTGEDITHGVLTQIIMEEEASGKSMLPVNFLRELIGMYGDSMQSMVPQFLEESLTAFQRNQSQFRDAMAGAFATGPFAELAKRNMELFTGAAVARKTGAAQPAEPPESDNKAELDELKAQLAALQEKLDKLGG
jgi:polyhydroxyalkanoate synthesis repressor PhaR